MLGSDVRYQINNFAQPIDTIPSLECMYLGLEVKLGDF